ncbi:MAG: hypothetical protein AB2A00_34825 [Myxococcota bacterium]
MTTSSSERPHVPLSAIAASIHPERLQAVLAPWLPDPADRAFVVRCLVHEGPHHHRGANYVLISLLGLLVEAVGVGAVDPDAPSAPVPMRLPPDLLEHNPQGHFPLRLPLAPLRRLAPEGSSEFQAMVDCLTDGPPQHALANAATVAMIGALLDKLAGGRHG